MAKQPNSVLRRTAAEVKRYRVMRRILPIVIGILTLLLILIYVVSVLYGRYGSFTVTVQKYDAMKYALTLSTTPDFESRTSQLNVKVANDITNIRGDSLPEDLDMINGEHNGENYAAYTFYCKNAGSEAVTYRYQLYISNTSKGIERAARIRLYINGVPTTYARTATDGSGPEPDTVEFKTETIVTDGTISGFKPGDLTKYTVVIWLEGDDPDCVDSVLGGKMKVDMSMSVIKVEAEEE